MKRSKVDGGLKISWGAVHRSGVCEKCHILFEKYDTGKFTDDKIPIIKQRCPKCFENVGELISRQISIKPPDAPTCMRTACLLEYLKQTICYTLVVKYHARRVAYAEKNRRNRIPYKYRTAEHSPQTIWQAIFAIVKLSCPILRDIT